MYLFLTKLSADSCDLLEMWFDHELRAAELCDNGGKILVAVYHAAGSQLGRDGKWTVRAWGTDSSFNLEADYPLDGFNPADALEAIKAGYCRHENAERLARNLSELKRLRERIAAEVAAA